MQERARNRERKRRRNNFPAFYFYESAIMDASEYLAIQISFVHFFFILTGLLLEFK